MKPEERRVTFPTIGRKNSEIIKDFLESLELKVIMPPPTTHKTMRLGAKYTAGMICFPLKVTLGNYIEALELGANTLLSYDTRGYCRFRQYNLLHEFTLNGLGYNFEMFVMNPTNILGELHKLSGKNRLTILKKAFEYYHKLQQQDSHSQEWSTEKPNIGIIGEIFCSCDERVNQGLEEKISMF